MAIKDFFTKHTMTDLARIQALKQTPVARGYTSLTLLSHAVPDGYEDSYNNERQRNLRTFLSDILPGFFDSTKFYIGDFSQEFILKLKLKTDPVSQYVFGRLSRKIQNAISGNKQKCNDPGFIEEINQKILKDPSFYAPPRFSQSTIPIEAQSYISSNQSGNDRETLNLLLLINAYKGEIKRSFAFKGYQNEIDDNLRLIKQFGLSSTLTADDLLLLPPGSFAVQFRFELTDYWYSADNCPYYPLENPVRKEWVFKVPEMAASGWKGVFRQACRDINPDMELRFFGYATDDAEEKGAQGILHFYSTFFNKIGLYAINPHDRETKAGTNPVYYEVVPYGAEGGFSVLCIYDEKKDTKADMQALAALIEHVFTESGFGAKTGIGFGRGRIKKAEQAKAPPLTAAKLDPNTQKKLLLFKSKLAGASSVTPTIPIDGVAARTQSGVVHCEPIANFKDLEGKLKKAFSGKECA